MRNILILPLLAIVCIFSACKDQADKDRELIESYINQNGLETEVTTQGIHYIIINEGNTNRPTISNVVEVDYEGYKLNGEVFDSSYERGERATFGLYQVIEGWQIGIPIIGEGGEITLIIPSAYAYGSNPPPGSSIGRNEVLVFDVKLYDIIQ